MNAVALRWPPKELSPNARSHYMTKHRATRAYRQAANYGGFGQQRLEKPVCVILPLVKDKRRRDLDNVLAALKSALDGLTDCGWWTDDHLIGGYQLLPEIHCVGLTENRVIILASEEGDLPQMNERVALFRSACAAGNVATAARELFKTIL